MQTSSPTRSYIDSDVKVGPQSDAPRRCGSVEQVASRLMAMSDQLEAAFKELDGRLRSVMSHRPCANDETSAKVGQPCELAQHLSDSADRVESIAVAIRAMTDRLEV